MEGCWDSGMVVCSSWGFCSQIFLKFGIDDEKHSKPSWNKPPDCLLDIASCGLAWVGVRNESAHAQGWFPIMESVNPVIQFRWPTSNIKKFFFPGQD